MKWPIIILMGIVLATAAFADDGLIETYRPNEVFSLNVHLTNLTGDVIGANCQATVFTENFSVKDNITMNEIGRGYYNATYNSSDVGKYFCLQNCTLGTQYTAGACDFIIGGESKVGALIAIVMIIIAIIVFYLYMVKNLNLEALNFRDKSQLGLGGGVKLLLLMLSFWIILIPLNFAIYLTDLYLGNDAIVTTFTTIYWVAISINTLMSFYMFFFVLKIFINKLQGD